MCRLAVLFTLVSVTAAFPIGNYNDHCNGLQCPKYTVLNSTKDYEVRHYPSFKWASASTHQKTLDYKDASKKNFMKLFRYISGANEEKKKIEMTAPVLNHIPVTQGPFCAPDFKMHFFVPYEFQQKTPKPLNNTDNVQIVQLPEMIVFVKSFGGYMSMDDIQENGVALGKALQRDGLDFDDTQLFTAGYDSPFKIFNRHNEIMFLPKTKGFTVP